MDTDDKVVNVNYVYDALKERLPEGYSINRSEYDSMGMPAIFYQWTRWKDGTQMMVQVDEHYAHAAGNVDKLCDQLMDAVYEGFADPLAKYTTPLWKRGLAPVPNA